MNNEVYITRVVHFSIAHRILDENLSDEENLRIFGTDSKLHGHNVKLEVTVKGKIDSYTGYVFDTKKLKEILNKEIIAKLDHTYINEIPYFKKKKPTMENLLVFIWDILYPKLNEKNVTLYKLKLILSENNYAEYFG